MSRIHLLGNSLIDKIAAGEVVERPASVVKELMENSIDAGANSLTVEIRDGGTSYIRISDNGKGIPKDEIKIAFMRHATSKLNAFEDLEDILTLGFRGEALSSIASVSDVEMITKTINDSEGTRVELSGGNVTNEEVAPSETGTVIIVKNLFYNTPARRKFLKKPAVESGYVSEVVNRIALGHPHIGIKYINNGNTVLQTSGNNDLKTAVFHIYGKEQALKMVEASLSKEGYSIKGLVGKPELSRANRTYESFFINGRYVKSSVVSNAAEDAYKGRLMTGRFPVFVLNMTVPKNTVDVNVHPTKLEVRFSDEEFIYELVYNAITKALEGQELIPQVNWSKPKASEKKGTTALQTTLNLDGDFVYNPKHVEGEKVVVAEDLSAKKEEEAKSTISDIVNMLYNDAEHNVSSNEVPKSEEKTENTFKAEIVGNRGEKDVEVQGGPVKVPITKAEPEKKRFFNHYKIVGQIFNTYWIVEQDDKMYMIDQHAAHERVLYERLTKKITQGEVVSQILLQPVAVNLSQSEKQIVEDNRDLFENFGYEIEDLGNNACALRAVPFVFDNPSNVSFFTDLVDILRDKSLKSIYETKLDAIATMSCKAAVKGNNRLSLTEARVLIEEMLSLENPFNCPHGRPTIIEMTKYELEKKFKRIV